MSSDRMLKNGGKERQQRRDVAKDDDDFEMVNVDNQDSHISQLLRLVDSLTEIYPFTKKEFDAQAEFGKLRETNDRYKPECSQLKRENEELSAKLELEKKQSEKVKADYRDELYKMQQKIEKLEKVNEDQLNANRRLEKQVESPERSKASDSLLQKQNDSLQRQLLSVRNELKNTKEKLEEKTQSTNRLENRNPDIAELSDRFRPTKIAERFQELYDDQWTDAFETVNKTYGDERRTINKLLDILKDADRYCKAVAERQMKFLQKSVMMSSNKQMQSGVYKQLKDFRKALVVESTETVHQEYMNELDSTTTRKVPEFVKKCIEICWQMAVQDPPLDFYSDAHSGESFDSDKFKAYTRSGDTVAFMVWPALLLHEGGFVLCKGVVQCFGGAGRLKSASDCRRGTEDARERSMHVSKETYRVRTPHQAGEEYLPTSDDFSHTNRVTYTPTYEQKVIQPKSAENINASSLFRDEVNPSRYDLERYFRYARDYGADGAKSIMGRERYEHCRRYVAERYGRENYH